MWTIQRILVPEKKTFFYFGHNLGNLDHFFVTANTVTTGKQTYQEF